MLETLQLSVTNITIASPAMPPLLLTPYSSLKSTIVAFMALRLESEKCDHNLLLFTKSDLKVALIPVVGVHSDTPWFCEIAENHLRPLDRLYCPLTA